MSEEELFLSDSEKQDLLRRRVSVLVAINDSVHHDRTAPHHVDLHYPAVAASNKLSSPTRPGVVQPRCRCPLLRKNVENLVLISALQVQSIGSSWQSCILPHRRDRPPPLRAGRARELCRPAAYRRQEHKASWNARRPIVGRSVGSRGSPARGSYRAVQGCSFSSATCMYLLVDFRFIMLTKMCNHDEILFLLQTCIVDGCKIPR